VQALPLLEVLVLLNVRVEAGATGPGEEHTRPLWSLPRLRALMLHTAGLELPAQLIVRAPQLTLLTLTSSKRQLLTPAVALAWQFPPLLRQLDLGSGALKAMAQLRALNLQHVRTVSKEHIVACFEALPRLQSVSVSGGYEEDDQSPDFTWQELVDRLAHLPTLRMLAVDHVTLAGGPAWTLSPQMPPLLQTGDPRGHEALPQRVQQFIDEERGNLGLRHLEFDMASCLE